jgi:hypothetical protein
MGSEAAFSPSDGWGMLAADAGPVIVTANAKAVAEPKMSRGNRGLRRVTMILLAELKAGCFHVKMQRFPLTA